MAALTLWLLAGWPQSAWAASTGDLDTTFGTGGIVASDFGIGRDEYGIDVAVDAAGRTVVIGDSQTASVDESGMAIARYTPSGQPDLSFGGGDGTLALNFGPQTLDFANGGTVDPNGRIIIVGSTCSDAEYTECFGIAVARLTNSDQLDPTFGGGDGMVAVQLGEESRANHVAVDPNGRIIVVGATDDDLMALRFTPSGTLDPSFSGDGIATVNFGGISYGNNIGVDSAGRIDVAGTVEHAGEVDFAAARLLDNGTLDPSFSGDGRVTTDIDALEELDFQGGMAVDASDRIVVSGQVVPPSFSGPNHLALVRYTSSGKLDPTFGDEGVVLGGDESSAGPVAIDATERPVVIGHIPGHDGDLLRFQTDGALDLSFGGGDGVAQELPSGVGPEAVAIDPSRRIVVGGHSWNGSDSDFAAARFLSGEPAPPLQTLSVSVGGSGSGSVTAPGVSCPGDCFASYAQNAVVELVPSPVAGSSFAGWSGGCTGVGECRVTLATDTAITAAFTAQPNADPGGSAPSPPVGAVGTSFAKPKTMRCRKGFKKRKVRGKQRCVKVKRARHHPRKRR